MNHHRPMLQQRIEAAPIRRWLREQFKRIGNENNHANKERRHGHQHRGDVWHEDRLLAAIGDDANETKSRE